MRLEGTWGADFIRTFCSKRQLPENSRAVQDLGTHLHRLGVIDYHRTEHERTDTTGRVRRGRPDRKSRSRREDLGGVSTIELHTPRGYLLNHSFGEQREIDTVLQRGVLIDLQQKFVSDYNLGCMYIATATTSV